uniref:RND transporter n=1 Tax=Geobacter sp. (strain M21) TaxID=443144 RepID=C6DZ03_GEOSM
MGKGSLSYKFLIPLALLLGFAPFYPQPHIVEKIGMLSAGTLTRPIDIFDLFWHAWPFVLLVYRVLSDFRQQHR